MAHPSGFRLWIKVALVYGIFMLLYFAWKLLPVFPLNLIVGINESNFQHFKATFFAFLLADGIEYLVCRRNMQEKSAYWYGSLMAALFAPWAVFLLWYIAPAIYGKWPQIYQEIIYANVITIVVAFVMVTFEKAFRQIPFTRSLKTLVLALVIISIGLYIIFTYRLPWADIFVEPDWKEKILFLRRLVHV
jgi:hypothetical protein